jgi:hypothetical protein
VLSSSTRVRVLPARTRPVLEYLLATREIHREEV